MALALVESLKKEGIKNVNVSVLFSTITIFVDSEPGKLFYCDNDIVQWQINAMESKTSPFKLVFDHNSQEVYFEEIGNEK